MRSCRDRVLICHVLADAGDYRGARFAALAEVEDEVPIPHRHIAERRSAH